MTEESVANARLIAAAPELLEALKETLAQLEYIQLHMPDVPAFDDPEETTANTCDRARAVLAKAEGR